MNTEIIIALISLIGTLGGSLGGIIVSQYHQLNRKT